MADEHEQSAEGQRRRPALSVTEAARATGTSRSTVRRALDAGRLDGAYRVQGQSAPEWRIPIPALLAAGFRLHVPTAGPSDEPPPGPAVEGMELERLRAENADLRVRAEVAEARATERLERIALLHRYVAAIEARTGGPPTMPPADHATDHPQTADGPARTAEPDGAHAVTPVPSTRRSWREWWRSRR